MNTLTFIYFKPTDGTAALYSKNFASGYSQPVTKIGRDALPTDHITNWDTIIAALNGFLGDGETVTQVVIEPANDVPATWDAETDEFGSTTQTPTSWRPSFNAAVSMNFNGAKRTVVVNSESGFTAPARDGLIALWQHFQSSL